MGNWTHVYNSQSLWWVGCKGRVDLANREHPFLAFHTEFEARMFAAANDLKFVGYGYTEFSFEDKVYHFVQIPS